MRKKAKKKRGTLANIYFFALHMLSFFSITLKGGRAFLLSPLFSLHLFTVFSASCVVC